MCFCVRDVLLLGRSGTCDGIVSRKCTVLDDSPHTYLPTSLARLDEGDVDHSKKFRLDKLLQDRRAGFTSSTILRPPPPIIEPPTPLRLHGTLKHSGSYHVSTEAMPVTDYGIASIR